MRHPATTILLLLALAGLATTAVAGPPVAGTYSTLGGTLLPGRAAESNPCDGCDGQLGNMIHAESWNGSTLGGQWVVSCPAISAPPTLLLDTVVGGNGQRIYRTSYSGGTLWLSGAGAWGGGDAYYSGTLSAFTTVATIQVVGGNIVGVVSNINMNGNLDGYGDCFSMAISNAAMVGRTPGAAPGVFPAFQGPGVCTATGTSGSWWTVSDATLSILGTCATDARSTTWGRVKTLYR